MLIDKGLSLILNTYDFDPIYFDNVFIVGLHVFDLSTVCILTSKHHDLKSEDKCEKLHACSEFFFFFKDVKL